MKRSAHIADLPDGTAIQAPRRVVLLGASNLTKGIATVLATAQGTWGQPLEVLTALGHGRSYGQSSRVLGRELPGIVECGLWPWLARSAAVPTAALITDIGNDLLYDCSVESIENWLDQCLERLAAAGARTVVTQLPVDNLRSLSPTRFRLLRKLFFPRCRLDLREVDRRARQLNEAVRRLAQTHGAQLVSQRLDWYGWDPIHIRSSQRGAAWSEILSAWADDGRSTAAARGSWARTLYLRSRTPEWRRLWGIEQRGLQPSARLTDGTTVAIY